MGKTVIKLKLSQSGVDEAISKLNSYKSEIERKTEEFRKRVAERLRDEVDMGFANAVADTIVHRGGGVSDVPAHVEVTIDNSANVSLVIAKGEDAIWAEFGSGVYYNGSAGSSPHPAGQEFGMIIGGYGKGFGKRDVWGYKDDSEEKFLTHGVEAQMPMSKAMGTVINEIYSIAKEVFR